MKGVLERIGYFFCGVSLGVGLGVMCASCASVDLPRREVVDTSPLAGVMASDEAVVSLWQMYNDSNNRRVEEAACLFGQVFRVGGKPILQIERASRAMPQFQSLTRVGFGCPFGGIGTAHTHIIRGASDHSLAKHSTVDEDGLWDKDDSLISLVIWRAEVENGRKILRTTWRLKHGRTGYWTLYYPDIEITP